ncbi:helix-turn-helix transcriptional regulator [Streptomyces sp. NRRL S-350]|uniref:helix-turn-helix transcriptional regulator n=1 Tax=Streptomyces sp. NRRL S-350 TaxID=1463902 RepID=UPI000AC95D74|nr:helix-turn-helix transcriptional regulator [Streptomyces sp. NRRL S-350]
MTERRTEVAHGRESDLSVYAWFAENRYSGAHDPAVVAQATGLSPAGVTAAVGRLVDAGLLAPAGARQEALRVVSPDSAFFRRAAPVEAEIRQRQDHIARMRSRFDEFAPLFPDTRESGAGIEVIPTLAEVRFLLNRLGEQCATEVVSCQPGGGARVPEAMSEALGRDRAMLERGVRIRTLYHHTARFNGPSQAYVAAASALGAEYRTTHELAGRIIIMDRETAFLPAAGPELGAVVIREPSTVAYLYEMFELSWGQATPFRESTGRDMEAVARELHRTILRLLADGLKDEAIARRLGMSLRTARRHIAEILEQLGADSRFQAGVAASRAGLLDT